MIKFSLRRKILGLATLAFAATFAATLAPSAISAEVATITYRRVFKGSNPEFIELKVSDDAQASYDIRQLSEDADPQSLDVSQALADRIFQLADHVHDFENSDFDVHHKMANLGEKTLRYQKGETVHETKFNYTINRDAGQLEMIFEGLVEQQQDLLKLEQKLKYDHLGVNDVLRQFEIDLDHRLLPEPQQFLPVLDRIADNAQLVDIARQRARAIAQRIRTSTPTTN